MKFGNVVIRRKVPCTMRDGITLYSDIYLPDETGEYPVLLMRQPYGRSIASTVTHAHPVWYASKGYIVVIQDVRGRGESEGEFNPFVQEAEDGFDTIEWAASLSGSTGNVGMYGFSYQGLTQWAAVSLHPLRSRRLHRACVRQTCIMACFIHMAPSHLATICRGLSNWLVTRHKERVTSKRQSNAHDSCAAQRRCFGKCH